LKDEGFIEDYKVETESVQGSIQIFPKYDQANNAVLRGLKRVSKPSRRYYVKKADIPRVRNGLGIAILTTARGVLTDKQARDAGVGGEVLCYVW
jgi:small subunit ribosomal protein S8